MKILKLFKWGNKDNDRPVNVQDAFFDNQKRYMEDVKHLYEEKTKVEFVHGLTIVNGLYLYHILTNEEIDPAKYNEIKEAIENILWS